MSGILEGSLNSLFVVMAVMAVICMLIVAAFRNAPLNRRRERKNVKSLIKGLM